MVLVLILVIGVFSRCFGTNFAQERELSSKPG